MRGLLSILSLFRNSFNKFNNTRAGMLDSYYHMTLRLLRSLISDVIYLRNKETQQTLQVIVSIQYDASF